jgi:hypothetical protein
MVLEPVVVLKVIKGMVVIVPCFDHQCWILIAVKVPKASKAWCHPLLNDPF